MMTLGRAYRINRAHGYELISVRTGSVTVRGYGEWPVIGFLRLAEALEKERYIAS